MIRALGLAYAVVAYLVFLGTSLYAVGFLSGLLVPKTIDDGPVASVAAAVVIDLALLSLFAVQHSLMARSWFKRWWTRLVPPPIERSTYVLLSSLVLVVLFWQWRPLPTTLWQVREPWLWTAITLLSFAGWLLVAVSSFLIDHFEMFGLRQAHDDRLGRPPAPARFATPALYRLVRHPIYLGFLIAFWASPHMTVGHLLFAAAATGYILLGALLEEADLIRSFGDDYRRYRREVPMLIPWRGRG